MSLTMTLRSNGKTNINVQVTRPIDSDKVLYNVDH